MNCRCCYSPTVWDETAQVFRCPRTNITYVSQDQFWAAQKAAADAAWDRSALNPKNR